MKIFAIIAIVLLAVIFTPILGMWCVDTLFGTNIPLNFKTWFAGLLLLALMGGGMKVSTSK